LSERAAQGARSDLLGIFHYELNACYELATEGPERGPALCGLVRCTQAMRRYESSLQLITGIRQEQPDLAQTLRPHAVEAAWQLGSWDRLTEVLQEPSPDGPCDFQALAVHSQQSNKGKVKLGRAVLAVHERDSATLSTTLRETTLEVARAASAAARESYTRAYQHLLCAIFAVLRLKIQTQIVNYVNPRFVNFNEPLLLAIAVGLCTALCSFPVLMWNIMEEMQVESDNNAYEVPVIKGLHVLSDIDWVSKYREGSNSKPGDVAKNLLARCDITTPSFSVRQTLLRPLSVLLQDLKLKEDAKTLELAFARLCRKHKEHISMEHPDTSLCVLDLWENFKTGKEASDALLLLPKVAEVEFQEAKEQLRDSEAAYFYHASYLDGLLKGQISEAEAKAARNENCPFDRKNLVTFTVRGYLQALQRGVHFILNRVLQLAWECCEVDFYKADVNSELASEAGLSALWAKGRRLMPWMWYTVLSQLISRALHPDMRCFSCMEKGPGVLEWRLWVVGQFRARGSD
ncbi:Atr, partial [Symbiodinium sp. KB8]